MTNNNYIGERITAETFAPGDVVQLSVWCGVVQDIYTSAHTGDIVLKILFAKNIYKGQPAELHSAQDLAGKLKRADRDQLAAEVELLQQGLARRLEQITRAERKA